MFGVLLSFRGRVSVAQYWFRYWLPIRMFIVLYFVIGGSLGLRLPHTPLTTALILCVLGVLVWIQLVGEVKRWHDRGKSAWWVLLQLVPLVGLVWSFIELNILEGNQGDNRYGPNPEPHVPYRPA